MTRKNPWRDTAAALEKAAKASQDAKEALQKLVAHTPDPTPAHKPSFPKIHGGGTGTFYWDGTTGTATLSGTWTITSSSAGKIRLEPWDPDEKIRKSLKEIEHDLDHSCMCSTCVEILNIRALYK